MFLHSLKKFFNNTSFIEPLVSSTISVSGIGCSSKLAVTTPSSNVAFLYDQSTSYLIASLKTYRQSTIGFAVPISLTVLTSLFVENPACDACLEIASFNSSSCFFLSSRFFLKASFSPIPSSSSCFFSSSIFSFSFLSFPKSLSIKLSFLPDFSCCSLCFLTACSHIL